VQEEYTENPEIITHVDGEQAKLHVEISLVNVEKDNISLMMDENGFYLRATSDDVTFVAALSFLRAVNPSEAKAVFEDGFLRIEAPFKEPLGNYVKIPIEEKE
jgi:HSP20 family molecular chaperone IbpA